MQLTHEQQQQVNSGFQPSAATLRANADPEFVSSTEQLNRAINLPGRFENELSSSEAPYQVQQYLRRVVKTDSDRTGDILLTSFSWNDIEDQLYEWLDE